MPDLTTLINSSAVQNSPMAAINHFITQQQQYKDAKDINNWRFVGYALEIGYDNARIITNDAYKQAVGGIPRGSFLILVPSDFDKSNPHFTLIRVKDVSPTPLSTQVQQTYFELHKKSMPELDIWTANELQWGALDCDILGMFYMDPDNSDKVSFSGDVNNIVSAHKYEVYAPDEPVLDLIVNGTVRQQDIEAIGTLRTMECRFNADIQKSFDIPVKVSVRDFWGCRTAMFGKTRLGKSNTVKRIAQAIIDATDGTRNVGQIIFDINGEYANDNDQDTISLKTANPDRCVVYALQQRGGTPSKKLKLNFYEYPDKCKEVINGFLESSGRNGSIYVSSFMGVKLPSADEIRSMQAYDEKTHAVRKIQMYWAILNTAGFAANPYRLQQSGFCNGISSAASGFDPSFNKVARHNVYTAIMQNPIQIKSLDDMTREFINFKKHLDNNNKDQIVAFGKTLFTPDELALLDFLQPTSGAGAKMLTAYKPYHDPNATDFVADILKELDDGMTVILDLGNATDSVRQYFSDMLSKEVFTAQEDRFVNNAFGDKYIQLYFEEAHNLFPPDVKDNHDIYSRFAKEGAKFHIGMVYSTQSPSTISRELLNQTENFFVGHLSSSDEAKALTKTQIAFSGIEQDILSSKTPGYMRMLTMSNRFVVPVQIRLFAPAGNVQVSNSQEGDF